MTLDLFTVTVMTALVASVASLTFILDTVIRRDVGPGRLWAVAFFCGLATTVAYVAWSSGVGGALSVAVGNTLFVLVPGGREISWKKLRAHLGVNRMTMPDAAGALDVTGYERGTITPFGSRTALPVIADETLQGTVSIGAGTHGAGATVDAAALVAALDATVADVTDPETPRS